MGNINNDKWGSILRQRTGRRTIYRTAFGNVYYYRVRASNGQDSDYSPENCASALAAPTPTSPLDGNAISTNSVNLQWEAVSPVTGYSVDLGVSCGDGSVLNNTATAETNYPVSNLVSGTYYWRVQAFNGTCSGISDESSCRSFVVSTSSGSGTPTPEPNPGPNETGTIKVRVLVDGDAWEGPVNFKLTGPETFSGTSAPISFSDKKVGGYTLEYVSGGPAGGTFDEIIPVSQTLSKDDTVSFAIHLVLDQTVERRCK